MPSLDEILKSVRGTSSKDLSFKKPPTSVGSLLDSIRSIAQRPEKPERPMTPERIVGGFDMGISTFWPFTP